MRERISLTEAARRLRLGYSAAYNRLLRGALKGGRDERGHWYVDSIDLERQARVEEDARSTA
jgi:hypothetical protein